jgi:uncharacterized protein (DUF2235 family)
MANIIICADGTWNRPEQDITQDFPTNVLKLARAIKPSVKNTQQHVFYDWGLGSYHNNIIAGATGRGIHKNILDCYRYIVQNYSPNDKIYLFGFSRGAYTVRALSGLINNCGILKRIDARLIAQAWKIYKSPLAKNHPNGASAKKFSSDHSHRSKKIHFIGVWDTVGALGIPLSIMGLFESHDEFYDSKMGPNVSIARHALAIDEQRQDFEPTLWTPRATTDLKQVWFAGVHADIGGSYAPDKNTGAMSSNVSLEWMLNEATQADLHLEAHIKNNLSTRPLAKIHKSRNHVYRLKTPLYRELIVADKPSTIHPSVKERYLSDKRYRPYQLKKLVERIGWINIDTGF